MVTIIELGIHPVIGIYAPFVELLDAIISYDPFPSGARNAQIFGV
jgi:hypothetical protein